MVLNLSLANIYHNISSLSSLSGTLVVTNISSQPIYLVRSATQPTATTFGALCSPGEEVVSSGEGYLWVMNLSTGPIVVQSIVGAATQYSVVDLPPAMYTTDKEGYMRLKVEPMQGCFDLGHQARSFKELSLAAGAVYTIKFVRTVNSLVRKFAVELDEGSLRCDIFRGATEAGVWSTTGLPVLAKNEMTTRPTPYYVPSSVLYAGGTISGGTQVDVLRVVASTATANQATVGVSQNDEIGVPPTTSYYRFTNIGNGTASGVFRLIWDEYP